MDRITQIAIVCHEANVAYCRTIGEPQPNWEEAPTWQKASAIKGVQFHLTNLSQGRDLSPAASHESWMEEKRKDGWKYGPVKNEATKEHPCYVPYDQLPMSQRQKDYIFGAIVKSFFITMDL